MIVLQAFTVKEDILLEKNYFVLLDIYLMQELGFLHSINCALNAHQGKHAEHLQ